MEQEMMLYVEDERASDMNDPLVILLDQERVMFEELGEGLFYMEMCS